MKSCADTRRKALLLSLLSLSCALGGLSLMIGSKGMTALMFLAAYLISLWAVSMLPVKDHDRHAYVLSFDYLDGSGTVVRRVFLNEKKAKEHASIANDNAEDRRYNVDKVEMLE